MYEAYEQDLKLMFVGTKSFQMFVYHHIDPRALILYLAVARNIEINNNKQYFVDLIAEFIIICVQSE